jgi:hypothetical protein
MYFPIKYSLRNFACTLRNFALLNEEQTLITDSKSLQPKQPAIQLF